MRITRSRSLGFGVVAAASVVAAANPALATPVAGPRPSAASMSSTHPSTHTRTHPSAPTSPAAAPTIAARWAGVAQVRTGRRIVARGSVSGTTGSVRVERRVSGAWRASATGSVRRDGTWSTTVTAPTAPSAQTYRAVWLVAGRARATGVLPALDVYRLMTYSVSTRGTLVTDVEDFAAAAARTYADPRGWRRAHLRFERVRRGGDFTLVLAQAKTLPSFSPVCSVRYSCRVGRYVVINETPWLRKTPAFTGNLATYRHMVVNHETGHRLGSGHAYCSGRGRPAPVMQQQSKGMQGCRPNAWPLPVELTTAR